MMQIIEQTDEQKLKMYMKVPKKQLAEMLIECNKIIAYNIKPTVFALADSGHLFTQFKNTCE